MILSCPNCRKVGAGAKLETLLSHSTREEVQQLCPSQLENWEARRTQGECRQAMARIRPDLRKQEARKPVIKYSDTPTPRKGDLLISRANTVELVGAVVLVKRDYPNLMLSDKTLRLNPASSELVAECPLLYCLRFTLQFT